MYREIITRLLTERNFFLPNSLFKNESVNTKMGFPSPRDSLMRVCECVATLSNRPGIFLETRGARGNNWVCSTALNRSLSTELHVPASCLCAHPSFLLIYPKNSFVTERKVKHMLAQSIHPPLTVSLSHTHILKESISSLYSLSASLGELP